MNISKETLSFLKDLKENNNREWFTINKKRFENALADFESFIESLFYEISIFEPSISQHKPKDFIFRIYRDVRFSKDKSPYKTHFGAHISSANKKSDIHSRAGYYIHVEPGNNSLLAGGAYMPESDWLKNIRQEIDYNYEEIKNIIESENFKNTFGNLEGEKLKKVPKEYEAGGPNSELLKMKSYIVTRKINDNELADSGFLSNALEIFKTLKPLNDFLNKCV